MLWRSSPAGSELEEVAVRWLSRLLGLPDWFGLINDTASSSTLTALSTARHRVDPQARTRGLAGGARMAVYTSNQAHSSVDKAVVTLGIGTDNLRKIPTDAEFRMDPGALSDAIAADAAAGIRPAAVVATVGTTTTTSIDPVDAIASVCKRERVWLHIDAAYGGAAAAVPELRWILRGAERADSLVVNPHKWLFVPVDCSVLYLRDPEATREAFSVVPDYLRSTEGVPNLMDYGVALGRRFRALKLWMVMRSMGTDGIVAALREHVRLAKLLASWVAAAPDFELAAPVPLSVVNFRFTPPGVRGEDLDKANESLAEAVNDGGGAFLTSTKIGGRTALHAAIGNLGTTEADVAALWDLVKRAALLDSGSLKQE
jgi:aromatic-L-amino-acid decarboxylase